MAVIGALDDVHYLAELAVGVILDIAFGYEPQEHKHLLLVHGAISIFVDDVKSLHYRFSVILIALHFYQILNEQLSLFDADCPILVDIIFLPNLQNDLINLS